MLLLLFVFLHFFFPPSYSSVPAVHLITTVYTTVLRMTECVCVREAGGVTVVLSDEAVSCRQDMSLVLQCACEGECVDVLRPFISDLLHFTIIMYNCLG